MKIFDRPDGTARILLVEGEKGPDTTYDRANVAIDNKTEIYSKEGGDFNSLPPQDLKVGQYVEVLFTGPRLTSEPIKGIAIEIVVLEDEIK